jgi:hypothetical protein
MRLRNIVLILLFLLLVMPMGALFIFVWVGYPFVIVGAQIFNGLIITAIYRAGIRSAMKTNAHALDLGKIVYLPLKIYLGGYFIVGIPLIWLVRENMAWLLGLHAGSGVGLFLTCLSGITYVVRSVPASDEQ